MMLAHRLFLKGGDWEAVGSLHCCISKCQCPFYVGMKPCDANGSMYRSNDANASITRGGGPSKRLTLDPNADADLFLVLVGCQRFFEPTAGRQQRAAQTNQPPVAVLVLVLLGRIHGGHDWRVFVSSCSCVPTSTTAFAFALARATGWLPRHATMPRHGHRRSWSFALRRWHSC